MYKSAIPNISARRHQAGGIKVQWSQAAAPYKENSWEKKIPSRIKFREEKKKCQLPNSALGRVLQKLRLNIPRLEKKSAHTIRTYDITQDIK
jgi:hypothetical protein